MEIKTDQITALLKEQLEKYDNVVDVSEVGEIIEVGDGVARASGLEKMAPSTPISLFPNLNEVSISDQKIPCAVNRPLFIRKVHD